MAGANSKEATVGASLIAVLALLSLVLVAPIRLVGERERERGPDGEAQEEDGEREFPAALRGHLEELIQTKVGHDLGEGPGSAEDAKLAAMAYPADDIEAQTLAGMRTAAKATSADAAVGEAATARWTSVGPTEAIDPATRFRNSGSYLPARYVAGGRTTAVAISPSCKPGSCLFYVGAAGGGIWRTKDVLASEPRWEYVSGSFAVVPGEPNVVYAATTIAGRSASSTCCTGLTRIIPGAPQWGLDKSTDGGVSWTFVHNGATATSGCTGDLHETHNLTPCSPRGVRRVVIDPVDPDTGYASSYCRGVWRSKNAGATWTQINPPLVCSDTVTASRPEIAVAKLPNGIHPDQHALVVNPNFRFHTYNDASPDVNFSAGAMSDWNWIGDPIYGWPDNLFYIPIIADSKVSGTMFAGTSVGVWRTKTNGMGTMTRSEFRSHCNEWTGDFAVVCGDWEVLGSSALAGVVSAIERAPWDNSTMWVATSTGGVYLSRNAAAEPASAVAFTRLDTVSGGLAPNRFVSGIALDPANPNRAWMSYQGFDASTPTTPGHLFKVTYDPSGGGSVTWVDRSYDYGERPMTDVAYDHPTGDLYGSSDFGVFRLAAGTTDWTASGSGMPNLEVSGLTIVPNERILYAATHGQGAWSLNLPGASRVR